MDNSLAHEVYNGQTPVITDPYQKIMMNLWAVDEMASGWAGTFVYPGTQVVARARLADATGVAVAGLGVTGVTGSPPTI